MKFDFVIGNPPYQEETESQSTRNPPVYNFFMDESYKIADVVELITPARFLFNAGYTPKAWNEAMLNDEHFKVIYYEPVSSKVFQNTDIKGGVAITYRNKSQTYVPVGIFTKFPELNSILHKVISCSFRSFEGIISSPLSYQLTDLMIKENPDSIGRLRTSAFTQLASVFFDTKPDDKFEYIQMIGLLSGKRVKKYIRKDYVRDMSGTLDNYTLLLAKANGSGQFGEPLSSSVIAEPGVGYTQTFIGVGNSKRKIEIENIAIYVHTKLCRAMLGVLKITQDCPGPKWKYVPLQDFTPNSDIDWSQSVAGIDKQLYKKYGLDENEITFIESHVKEMA